MLAKPVHTHPSSNKLLSSVSCSDALFLTVCISTLHFAHQIKRVEFGNDQTIE